MRFPALLAAVAALACALPASAEIVIKDRAITEPLVLDQPEDYILHKVYISGLTDMAALTLTGKINSVTITKCLFGNIWAGMNSKATAAEAQGAIVNTFLATDTIFEDSQHQLVCLREGAFGQVTFRNCKFRTSDAFLKKIYSEDPWRMAPPTTEFANIDRLELIDNEYTNTVLIVHPSVKMLIFRGDISNVRLASPNTHVIRLNKGEDPASIGPEGRVAAAKPAEQPNPDAIEPAAAAPVAQDQCATITAWNRIAAIFCGSENSED